MRTSPSRRNLSRRETMQALMAAFIPPVSLNRSPLADPARTFNRLDLLVAGPPGGLLDQWGTQIVPELQRALNLTQPIHQEAVGGADGLTGANRFEARATMDGGAALLLPGSAALAWLCGDSKVQFDIGSWTPMLTATAPCLVVGRPEFAGLPVNKRVRAAASRPSGEELPMLLALEQLGVAVQPVFGLETDAEIAQAYADRSVDLVFLNGALAPKSLARFPGAQPLMILNDGLDKSALFPDVPHYSQLKMLRPKPAEDLESALQAVMFAASLDMALMLPQLVPAAAIAQWRLAIQTLADSSNMRAHAASLSEQLTAGAEAAAMLRPLKVDSVTQLKLRKWLSSRFVWKAG